jgi:WhiB family transcriptional regulator, redox-sensing transcriptional regulator
VRTRRTRPDHRSDQADRAPPWLEPRAIGTVAPVMLRAPEAPTWNQRAVCRGESAGLFAPMLALESAHFRQQREMQAKRVCTQCPVRQECLAYALRVNEELGIWGGLDAAERRALR